MKGVVEAAWVWKFGTAPFKAVYGRIPGSGTYTKDFLQVSGPCAAAFDEVFKRKPQDQLALTLKWPNGARDGKLHEAADYSTTGRLNLRWDTDNAPDPWRLHRDPASSSDGTIPGNSDIKSESEADAELEKLKAKDLDPWLVAIKLRDEPSTLHVRAYLGNPPLGLEEASLDRLPEVLRQAISGVGANGGCAVARFSRLRAPKIVNQVIGALRRGPNVLLTGPPGTGKTVALEDLRDCYEAGGSFAEFDTERLRDSWREIVSDRAKARTVVFHPSYSYEEFVLGLYPVPAAGSGVKLEPRPGPLLSLAHWASSAGNSSLLIVDEFNRGNASAIFGDMLALLDKDKRSDPLGGQLGAAIDRSYPELAVRVQPDFVTADGDTVDESVRLPSSLSIVAAMNSSDRSVAPLDAALRRRFSIVHVGPDYEALAAHLGVAYLDAAPPKPDFEAWELVDVLRLAVAVLRTLNERIEMVLGSDFLLGHSLFWDVAGTDVTTAIGSMCAAFDERVASTLRIAFADQDELLAAILGCTTPPSSPSEQRIAHWLVPPAALSAVATPRLRIRRAQSMDWADAAVAFHAVL